MNALLRAAIAGTLGSLTTNLLHECLRRTTRDAPRVDLLGMQAFARTAQALDVTPPSGRELYATTLAADLTTNALYFGLAALAPRRYAAIAGATLGLIAGIGAVVLPAPLGLAARTTGRTRLTRGLTTALYTAGGVVAGLLLRESGEDSTDELFFARKHVVVSGGTRGLGFVLAQRLVAAGAHVTICGRSPDSLDRAVATLAGSGGSLAGFVADVRDRTQCEQFIERSVERFGPVDVLINNAGIIEVGPFVEQIIDDYREAMDTHFWAPLYLSLAVLPAMRARRIGSIANVASIGGVVGVPHLAPYSASKFAQVGFTQALAAEVAADGVSVTAITPGLMVTGSPDHAIFKGRNRAEYAWFTLSDANPLISVSVDSAARRILRGIRRGEARVRIGWTAHAATIVNALFPAATARLLRLAARLLPAPGGIGTERRVGSASHSRWTQNPLTLLNSRAMDRANQTTAPGESDRTG